jgi:hypothetical protein
VAWPLDKVLTQLASPDVKRRRKAAQEMIGREQDPVDEATVRRIARDDPDAEVRGCAVMELYLRELRDDEAAQAYRRAIAAEDWQGRVAGLNGLALVGDTADIDLLEPYTRDKDSNMADAARWAIQDIEAGGRRFDEPAETAAADLPAGQTVRTGPPVGLGVTVLRAGGWRAWTTGLFCVVLVPLALKGLTSDGWSGRFYFVMGLLLVWASVLSTVWMVILVTRKWYLAVTSEGIDHPRFGSIPWDDVREASVTDKYLVIDIRNSRMYERRAAARRSRIDVFVKKFLGGYSPGVRVPSLIVGSGLDEVADEINRRATAARRGPNYR